MDEFLVSGESHIRNLERGTARARDLAGRDVPVDGPAFGYLPDQFGHVGQMPQILRNGGIEHAVLWRGVPAAIDRTAFHWEAPDGSAVLAEYLAFGYSIGWEFGHQRDAEPERSRARSTWCGRSPRVADRVLITVGSDHADRIPQAELAPLLEEASAIAGVRAEFGSIASFLDAPAPESLPTWRGELRSGARAHLLPNVYSARVRQKVERGRLEALVERYAEPLAAFVPGVTWPADELDPNRGCSCGTARTTRSAGARSIRWRTTSTGATRPRGRRAERIVGGALGSLTAQVGPADAIRFDPSPFERDGCPAWGGRSGPRSSLRLHGSSSV